MRGYQEAGKIGATQRLKRQALREAGAWEHHLHSLATGGLPPWPVRRAPRAARVSHPNPPNNKSMNLPLN